MTYLGKIGDFEWSDSNFQIIAAAPQHVDIGAFLKRLLVDKGSKFLQRLSSTCDLEPRG